MVKADVLELKNSKISPLSDGLIKSNTFLELSKTNLSALCGVLGLNCTITKTQGGNTLLT